MADPTREVEIKGVAIRSLFEVVAKQGQEGAIQRIREAIPFDLRIELHDPVLAASWYPIAIYREVHKAAQKLLGGGPALSRRLAKEAVKADLDGVYKVLTNALKPHWLVSWAPRVFSRYIRGGKFVVVESRPGYARGQWVCPGYDESVWMDLVGSCEAALELSGGESVRHRILSGGRDGDSRAEIEFRWS